MKGTTRGLNKRSNKSRLGTGSSTFSSIVYFVAQDVFFTRQRAQFLGKWKHQLKPTSRGRHGYYQSNQQQRSFLAQPPSMITLVTIFSRGTFSKPIILHKRFIVSFAKYSCLICDSNSRSHGSIACVAVSLFHPPNCSFSFYCPFLPSTNSACHAVKFSLIRLLSLHTDRWGLIPF
jgi:hypothetical protein